MKEMELQPLPEILAFEWNEGNRDKNKSRHNVGWWECEQVFFNSPFLSTVDAKHSEREERQFGFGRTDDNRLLALVFVLRGKKIRVISARDMNKKERARYYEEVAKIQE
jgi:uncharacterized DUF497 family protein